mmetsp:Transcript_26245/g.74654  ORF Transcript_26245/g.74654 Transcript_26245/m.74654 type:complete len:204 (-) Transcript_26245:18-629(-)
MRVWVSRPPLPHLLHVSLLEKFTFWQEGQIQSPGLDSVPPPPPPPPPLPAPPLPQLLPPLLNHSIMADIMAVHGSEAPQAPLPPPQSPPLPPPALPPQLEEPLPQLSPPPQPLPLPLLDAVTVGISIWPSAAAATNSWSSPSSCRFGSKFVVPRSCTKWYHASLWPSLCRWKALTAFTRASLSMPAAMAGSAAAGSGNNAPPL